LTVIVDGNVSPIAVPCRARAAACSSRLPWVDGHRDLDVGMVGDLPHDVQRHSMRQ
jgi:hypothetical protein